MQIDNICPSDFKKMYAELEKLGKITPDGATVAYFEGIPIIKSNFLDPKERVKKTRLNILDEQLSR